MKVLETIKTPAYVLDEAALIRNMEVVRDIKTRAGIDIVLATKAFAMPAAFPLMAEYLDGTTASGLYEARLGAEHFGKSVHTYSPAYTEEDFKACLAYADHIYFNSVVQLKQFAPQASGKKIGLRVNPQLSLVKNSALYDPSGRHSRFGVLGQELTDDVLDLIDILHVHNLCENMAEESVRLIRHVADTFPAALERVTHVNFGGGHYITHPEYNREALIEALNAFKNRFDVYVTLEPGSALVYGTGYVVSTVLDVIERAGGNLAILDASASTHMPDVLEVPYRPHIINSGTAGEKAHTYVLGGNTCMTGDVIGTYSFDEPLSAGQTLIFTDMMQYSFVKNTTFNGVPLPDLGILRTDGTYDIVKQFGYEDFKKRLG